MNSSNIKEIQHLRIPNMDKIVHLTLYAILSFFWMYALVNKNKVNSIRNNAFLIFIVGSFFGILIEFLQENFTQTRSAEFLDVVSNCSGLIIGIIISKLILK